MDRVEARPHPARRPRRRSAMPPTKSEPKVFDDEESLCAAVQAILLEDVEELQAPDLDAEATAAALGSVDPARIFHRLGGSGKGGLVFYDKTARSQMQVHGWLV